MPAYTRGLPPAVCEGVVDGQPIGPRVGCRIGRDYLTRVAGPDVVAGQVLDRCLVTGAVLALHGGGVDIVFEAERQVELLVGGGGPLSHVTVSGLQRDDDGAPLAMHPVRAALSGAGYVVDHAEITWVNDGWSNASRGTIVDSMIGWHQNYIWRGDRQHPDGIQPYGYGDLLVERVDFHNAAAPWPLGADGQPVPVTGTRVDKNGKEWGAPTSAASMMINHEYPFDKGPVIIRGTRSWESGSVNFNFSSGVDPGQVDEWWDVDWPGGNSATLEGLVMEGNVVESHDRAIIRAHGDYLHRIFPTPSHPDSWKWGSDGDGKDLGPSDALMLRAPDGGLMPLNRRDLVY